jgi:hypothetical protein
MVAVSGIKHFCSRLEGRLFQLRTDHELLLSTPTRVLPQSGRQQCHLSFISEYTIRLVYNPGMSNVVADALSGSNSGIGVAVAAPTAQLSQTGPPLT